MLLKNDTIIGCAGLITNDFSSRMALCPWMSSLFIDQRYRGKRYAELLIGKAKHDTKSRGLKYLTLCTDLTGYYGRFSHIPHGYHPWNEESRIN